MALLLPVLTLATLTTFATFHRTATADLNSCRRVAHQAVRNCGDKFRSVVNANDATDLQTLEGLEDSGRTRGAGADLMNAANANSERWAEVPDYCMDRKRECADACNAVPAAQKRAATEIKTDCFIKIQRRLTDVQQLREQNAGYANAAATSGNRGGSMGAADLAGSNDEEVGCAEGEVCGQRHPAAQNAMTNIDMVNQLSPTHDCRYSGSANIVCTGRDGVSITIPSGPGTAFQPFR